MSPPDEIEPNEPPAPPATARWRPNPVRVAVILGLLVVLVALLVGTAVRLPYVIFSPGRATDVGPIVRVEGARTYPSRGDVLFLTVSVSNQRPNLWRFIQASLDSNSQVIGEREYLGRSTPQQDRRLNQALMTESQEIAKAEALEYLGYDVPVTGSGALVVEVSADGPSAGRLRRGDLITAIDGRPIDRADEVGTTVRAAPAGTTFTFAVTRGRAGERLEVPVTSRLAASGELRGRPFIGIAPVTKDLRYEYPVDITIDPGAVSGPSAGLAFTLAIIDEMSPGSLTGGRSVAVTGTIAADGTVGDVGGVAQKTVAARRAGARLMLVPPGEAAEARSRAGGSLRVVPVRTLDEAVRVLVASGGRAPERADSRRVA
jgi:PDZ domain-containing protein